ncbi:uncharacterized protein PADG_07064 [Paracoccidioides brasiliensis Pb18]|uniref:Mitochondrial intermembrane space import and assembly protein 40 n=1 Tax=Paracoccidioides brasiliensis (strain Pb18) TaxID=502780 RepID=C1GIH8_PARBD|nr:uncharacterized protein PADG_07064 [Paracoccidioides brasiliensis Pb18]EEH42244.1 hypothetical protein PADG_07064 [Paracoccidioides brasiliensis Pb18]
MFRSASRSVLRASSSSSSSSSAPTPRHIRLAQARRYISSDSPAPSRKPRSWKGTALRWALAAGAVYYYNTSSVFSEEPSFSLRHASSAPKENEDDSSLPTLESLTAAKKAKARSKNPSAPPDDPSTVPSSTPSSSSSFSSNSSSPAEYSDLSAAADIEVSPSQSTPTLLTPEELEEEASSEGAFNPETGEINWDCPCLGGMAHGPCGEEFRAAFSCFVYSTEEPKGMDCIEKFEGMQNCFRQHPELYPTETDEEDVDAQLAEESASSGSEPSRKPAAIEEAKPAATTTTPPAPSGEKAKVAKKSTTPASS